MKRTRIFLFNLMLFLIGTSAYADNYKTVEIYSQEEIEYIEKLQRDGLTIGANLGSLYIDPADPGDSLIYKYETLLEEFFLIDVDVITDEWGQVYEKLKDEEIDLLLNFTLSKKRERDFNLSIPIHSDKFYVVSNNRDISLNTWKDLLGKEVVVIEGSSYSEYLKKFKIKYNLNFTVKEVSSYHDYSDYDYMVHHSGDPSYHSFNTVKLGDTDPLGIGIVKSKVMLKDIINKALKYSHKEQLLKMLDNEKIKRMSRAFYTNLSPAEKNYLKNKKKIEIIVDSEFYPVFYYNEDLKNYDGIFSRWLNEFSQVLGIPIQVINRSPDESWNSMYSRFRKGEGDLTIMYFTPKRGDIHNFSMPLEYTDLMLISNGNKEINRKNISNLQIGAVKGDISESTAYEYFHDANKIVIFDKFEEMVDALKEGSIHSCVMDNDILMYYQQTRFDLSLNTVKILDKLPISFVVQDSNDPLLSIINRAANGFIDYKDIKMNFLQELSTIKIAKEIEYNNRKNLILFMLVVIILITAIIVAGSKYILNKNLHNLAYYDHLTTALNRSSFERDMNQLNFSEDLGIGMYIDLNGFKKINDNHGHHAGDMILKEVVLRLQQIYKHDKVYRLAGDEFFVFLKGVTLEAGMDLAEDTIKEIKKPIKVMNSQLKISPSIGICVLDKEIEDTEDFMHRADIAMYRAKEMEEGGVVLATRKLLKQYKDGQNLERELKKAIYTEKIIPYFQPKVDLNTNEVRGIEALARWTHPEIGVIPPKVFIPLAEKTGLIPKLDLLIAESTIKKLKNWIMEGHVSEDFKASFNISVKTFEEVDVYEQIKHLLNKYDLQGRNIEVEVTENIFINELTKMLEELKFLKEDLGTTIALDDFTAGHASLRGVGQLTIDTLKFDRSLLQIIKENSKKGRNIYSTLVKLSKEMGYTSVAEGIEEEYEREFLKNEGIDYGQGFYFAKPMPERDFIKYMDEKNLNFSPEDHLVETPNPTKKSEKDKVV